MAVRVKTESLLKALPFEVRSEVLRASAGGHPSVVVTPKALTGVLGDAYAAEKAHVGRGKVTADAVTARAVQALTEDARRAAGEGRSATWISVQEAKTLDPLAAQAYGRLRTRKMERALELRALDVPFPSRGGRPDLFFDRYLLARQGQAIERGLVELEAFSRLSALKDGLDAPRDLGAYTLAPVGEHLEADGRRLLLYGDADFTVRRGDALYAVSVQPADLLHGDRIQLTRYDLSQPGIEPLGSLRYATKSDEEMLDGLRARIGEAPATPRRPDEATLLRIGRGADGASARALFELLGALAGQDPAPAIARLDRVDETYVGALPELIARSGALAGYRELMGLVDAHGTLELGDADTYVRRERAFTKTISDDDDVEHEVTLTEGDGPFAIVDNIFGGLGHALDLAAAERGEFKLYLSHYGEPRGVLHVDAKGKVREAPEPAWLRAALDDLSGLPERARDDYA